MSRSAGPVGWYLREMRRRMIDGRMTTYLTAADLQTLMKDVVKIDDGLWIAEDIDDHVRIDDYAVERPWRD